ncbi:MAG: hypothetical protein CL535_16660 [Ahrensia sp.]|nr:hypothetical protein [Ahrensia sp.]MBV48208.1 hypothetical protein [Roseobacter sp.]MBV48309.1 hypothetical protein [Roseobacter sp.]|tara:strand:+ start:163047 stop:163814 length:768 start_codon:yes stop_codon:yes gene_type:complete
MTDRRTLIWWSTGAASFVAAQLTLRDNPEAIVARCETGNEDPDNYRFEADAMRRLNTSVTLLRSTEFSDVWEVWQKRRYMSGIAGAPCTSAMKIAPRIEFQRPTDIHVFGYTADREDVDRFERLKENYFELTVRAPLIDAGITKAASLAIVQKSGLELPRSYAMGFPNANCLQTGCVKATSPDYWSLYRHHFPENFARTAAYAREIGARLTRIKGERMFIDEIPDDWPMTNPIIPACDFLCALADNDNEPMEKAA